MSITYTVVTILGAAMAGFSAISVFAGAKFVVQPLADYGVPQAAWPWLGTAKLLGAIGLLAGFVVPIIGVLAAAGLVLYFLGAVVTVIRARSYAHIPYPLLYAAPAAASLALYAAA